MPETLKQKLVEKGWSEEEAARAHEIIYSPEKQRKFVGMKKDAAATHYWLTLIILAVLNLLITIVLIPVLIVFKPIAVSIIVLTIGLLFGFLFNALLRDIETEHHILASSFIPLIAILNIFIATAVAQSLALRLKIDMTQHPAILSIVYVIAFLSPYIVEFIQEILLRKGILRKRWY